MDDFVRRLLAGLLRPILECLMKGSTLERKAREEQMADENINRFHEGEPGWGPPPKGE